MKFVFVSETGDALSLAMRVANEGHAVSVMVADEAYREAGVGEGLVPLGPQPTVDAVLAEKPDVVVFDMVGFGELASALKGVGVPTFGGSVWADVVELNRAYGTALMAACGIRVPPTKVFKSWEDGIAHVRRTKGRYVVKPHGNVETALTYVSQGPEDCVGMLEEFARRDELAGVEYELQDFVEGIEVSCEGWFNGRRFVEPFNITFEEKRFLEGGLGPNTGCMGNVVYPVSARCRIVREGIGRLEKVLRASDYRGPIDLNSIVTPDGLFGLEFTARFGYDAVQALCEGLRMSLADLLHGVAHGTLDTMAVLHEYLIGVRMTVPPYPHTRGRVHVPVLGVNDENARHLAVSGVRLESGRLYGCAPDGNLLVATAWGTSVEQARKRVYRTVGNITIPNVQYRRDIGVRAQKALQDLRALGWLS